MKNTSKRLGLVLFISCFAVFNGSFFMEHYELSEATVEAQLQGDRKDRFIRHAADVINRRFSTNFGFISAIRESITSVNEEVLNTYSFTDQEIDRIVSGNVENFAMASLGEIIDQESEIGAAKVQLFRDYGSWLEGRQSSGEDDLAVWVNQVAENIRKYGIVSQWGFDKYQSKALVYTLTRTSSVGPVSSRPVLFLILSFLGCIVGGLMYILPDLKKDPPGIRNNGIYHKSMTARGWLGILTGSYLILFYIILYFFHEYMTTWIIMVDPVSFWLKGSEAGQFFLYGFMYTIVILVMGVRMIIKYRHSRYQVIRSVSVMFFQTGFAFLIPEILLRLNQPYFDFKNIWPLDYDFFFDNELSTLIESGSLGIFMLIWGIILVVLVVPIMVYFFGKRWYCSWVCGCGGLAETLGDPYRQLSDKSLKSWKIERYMIHGVLVFAVVMTAGVLYTYFSGSGTVLGVNTYSLRETYGAWIGAGFAGVVGTGFYPLMGNRVWCRFGCPLAAYLGIVQRFKSRFRITTNGGQCISCGNCSTYCEMGIDVRWYAQRGQNIVRSSCVGCGVCSSVCPRGVLNLEVKAEKGRFGKPELLG